MQSVQQRVPRRRLLGPGPSDVHPRVLEAMGTPLLGHLDPLFLELMAETQDMLRKVLGTTNQLTFPVSGTGSAGMETCVVNLIEPGDSMLVCVNGVFGTRMVDVAQRAGAKVTQLDKPWGETFPLDELAAALRKHKPKVLGIVHAETSTGAAQPLEGLGAVCRETGTLLLVDAVTSVGGMPVKFDEWQLDALYTGTQKCLSCPPGLAPVSFGPRAVAALDARKSKVQSWYLDLSMVKRYWGEERFYHHTAPISMIYALHEALRIVLEEGLDARHRRHELAHRALKAGAATLGLTYHPPRSLPMLNALRIPQGVGDLTTRKQLLAEHGIEIGGGLGDMKGKLWRIGLMGHGASEANVTAVLDALEGSLSAQGRKLTPGAAARAARDVYAASV